MSEDFNVSNSVLKTKKEEEEDTNDIEKPSSIAYLNINVDVSELIPGYQLFFQSRYQEALKFFESKKDTDIRFLIGYTKTLLAMHQIEKIKPFNLLITACIEAVNRTLGMIGVTLDKQTSLEQYLAQINELELQQRQLFFWAVIHCCQLQFFLYSKNSTLENITHDLTILLLAAKINPAAFEFYSYFPHWEFSNELKALFSIKISEGNLEEEQELQQKLGNVEITTKIRKDNEDAVYESTLEKELTLSTSEEVEKTWMRVCLVALAQKKIDLKFTFGLFEILQKMLPQFDLAYQFHGDALISHDRYSTGRKYYDKAIEINPLNVVALNNKGYSYEYDNEQIQAPPPDHQKLNLAIEFYKAAIDICPTYHIFHNNVSMCYDKLEDYNLGIHYCLNSLEINCEYQHGLNRLTDFLEKFTPRDCKNLQSYITRSTVLLKREDPVYFRSVFMIFEKSAPLLYQDPLQEALKTNFTGAAGFIIRLLQEGYSGNALPILKQLEEQARAFLTFQVYTRHLKQEFTYQPSCFYWELYLY